nr:hypothetical protein [Tanacetum cinerariifolium]
MEYLVKISKKARILELKRRYFKEYCSDNQYPVSIKKIQRIHACTHQKTTKETRAIRCIQRISIRRIKDIEKISSVVPTPRNPQNVVYNTLDTPKVFNWKTAKYGRIWYDEDIHDLRSIENEFLAIAFNDSLKSGETLSCEPAVNSLNDEIYFKILFDDSDDEDYTIFLDKNSFSYKIISINNMKTDSENDNEKVNMPSFSSPEPTVSCFNDLDFFKDFENEFPATVYNDAPTSKSDLLTEPTLNPQHIDELDLKDETSLSEYDEEEQNVLYFNDLFPFNIIQPDDCQKKTMMIMKSI